MRAISGAARRRAEPTVAMEIAGAPIVVQCPTTRVAGAVSALFAHHLVSDDERAGTGAIRVHLSLDARCTAIGGSCLAAGCRTTGTPWRWAMPPAVADAMPERLYYWLLLPVLTRALREAAIARLHAGCVVARWSGAVLVLGDSGAGKSTTAAGWAAAGGSVVADDTMFVGTRGRETHWSALRRPFHVAFDVVPRLKALAGLAESMEYLPGRRKVAYDWWSAYPTRVVDTVTHPRHVVLSSVGDTPQTRVRAADPALLGKALLCALSTDDARSDATAGALATCLDALRDSQVWDVRWGADVWSHPEHHSGVLRERFEDATARVPAHHG